MSGQALKYLPVVGVAQEHAAAVTAGGQEPSVWAERHSRRRPCVGAVVAGELEDHLAFLHIPDLDGEIRADRGEPRAERMERHAANLALVATEGGKLHAGLGVE